MDERAFASATRLAEEVRNRKIGCIELLDFFVARAERHNPALNAVVAWQIDKARDRARAADTALARGEIWGSLHGLPITVKESFNVAGLPTTWGNPLWKDNIAADNAVVVDRLLDAGAVIYGKTNVPFMLMDSQSYNEVYGTTNNPWDLGRGPGGSSGGEAVALAAGLSALGAGTDIAGSLRNPAHYCGVYGHKPSWGLIPTRGQSPTGALSPTDISVAGPMARHAEDLGSGNAGAGRPGCAGAGELAGRAAAATTPAARRFPCRGVDAIAIVRDRCEHRRTLRRGNRRDGARGGRDRRSGAPADR